MPADGGAGDTKAVRGGANYVPGVPPKIPAGHPPNQEEEECEVCRMPFNLKDNHYGACFGHSPEDYGCDGNVDRISKIHGSGSVWKIHCCAKIFPSGSTDCPEAKSKWSPDLCGGSCRSTESQLGLCKTSVERGQGTYAHRPQSMGGYNGWAAKDAAAYMESLPPAQPISAWELAGVRAQFHQDDVPYTESTAIGAVMGDAYGMRSYDGFDDDDDLYDSGW